MSLSIVKGPIRIVAVVALIVINARLLEQNYKSVVTTHSSLAIEKAMSGNKVKNQTTHPSSETSIRIRNHTNVLNHTRQTNTSRTAPSMNTLRTVPTMVNKLRNSTNTSVRIGNHTNEVDRLRQNNTSRSSATGETLGTAAVPPKTVSIVVGLSGEMGNQLSKIAFAKAIQLWAEEDYGINNTQLILRAQNRPKWYHAMKDTKACFPNTRQFDFRAGNTNEVDAAYAKQKTWLGEHNASLLELAADCVNKSCIDEGLAYLQSLLKKHPKSSSTLVNMKSNISFPFLTAAQFSDKVFVTMDRYYEELRKLFVFDEEACCKLRPDPDESVFHYRNFRQEMPRRWHSKGYIELSPNKTANELFGHLKPGEKVAITTRIGGPEAEEYVSALEARGLVVRLLEGQSGTEDFCFLRSAKKELVGMTMSTYAIWAGYLGGADRVRLYTVDSPTRRERFGDNMFYRYNWTNEALKRKVLFELYKTEETEELDAEEQNNH